MIHPRETGHRKSINAMSPRPYLEQIDLSFARPFRVASTGTGIGFCGKPSAGVFGAAKGTMRAKCNLNMWPQQSEPCPTCPGGIPDYPYSVCGATVFFPVRFP